MIEQPLTCLWAKVMADESARKTLKEKKKAASKILIRFVHSFGGKKTAVAIRTILTRLDGFTLAFQPGVLKSVKDIATSNPTIDSE
jgi:hypothetical protein